MNTIIKTKLDTKLTTNEFNLLCDLYNGSLFSLEPVNWKQNLFCYYEINELKSKWKINQKKLTKKLGAISALESLDLLMQIDIFWKRDESMYQTLNMVSPKQKISEILKGSDRDKCLRCSLEVSAIELFYRACQLSCMDYLIYTQDSTGQNKYMWGIPKEHLMKYISMFSEEYVFLRIQKLSDAILNGI